MIDRSVCAIIVIRQWRICLNRCMWIRKVVLALIPPQRTPPDDNHNHNSSRRLIVLKFSSWSTCLTTLIQELRLLRSSTGCTRGTRYSFLYIYSSMHICLCVCVCFGSRIWWLNFSYRSALVICMFTFYAEFELWSDYLILIGSNLWNQICC